MGPSCWPTWSMPQHGDPQDRPPTEQPAGSRWSHRWGRLDRPNGSCKGPLVMVRLLAASREPSESLDCNE